MQDGDTDAAAFSRTKIILTMLGLMLGLFLAGLDQTIVATALPDIARDLGAWERVSWIVTAYLVSSTAVTPLYGRFSDLYGRRPVVVLSLAVFIGASLLCALSRSLTELVAARVLQGIGGGGLRSMALIVIADLVPPRERGRYQSYFAGTMTTANALGPILGGIFTQTLSWHWIFWINLPIGAVACLLSSRFLARLRTTPRPVSVDWIGAVLIVAAVTLFLLGVSHVDGSNKLIAMPVILPICAGAVCMAGLIRYEALTPQPVLPLHLFCNPVFLAGSAVISLMSILIVGLIVIIPLDYQLALGLSPAAAGLRMIPLTAGTALGSLLAGQLVSHTGRYRPFAALGALIAALACLAMAAVGLGRNSAFDVVATGFVGVAAGFQISPISVAVQNALPREDTGIGMACLLLFRSLAGAIGAALFSVLFVNGVGTETIAQAQAMLRHATPADLAGANGSRDAFTLALSHIFLVGVVLMGGALAASLSLGERPLRARGDAPAKRHEEPRNG